MNRLNTGNIVTNAQQILSVGATTASKLFKRSRDDATTRLNNVEPTPKLETGTEYNKRWENEHTKEGEVSYPEPNQKQIEQNANKDKTNIYVEPDQYDVYYEENANARKLIEDLERNEYSGQSKELSRFIRNNNDWIITNRNLKGVGQNYDTKHFESLKRQEEEKGGKE